MTGDCGSMDIKRQIQYNGCEGAAGSGACSTHFIEVHKNGNIEVCMNGNRMGKTRRATAFAAR